MKRQPCRLTQTAYNTATLFLNRAKAQHVSEPPGPSTEFRAAFAPTGLRSTVLSSARTDKTADPIFSVRAFRRSGNRRSLNRHSFPERESHPHPPGIPCADLRAQ